MVEQIAQGPFLCTKFIAWDSRLAPEHFMTPWSSKHDKSPNLANMAGNEAGGSCVGRVSTLGQQGCLSLNAREHMSNAASQNSRNKGDGEMCGTAGL